MKHPQSGPDLKMRPKMAMGGTYDWDGPGIFRSGTLCGCFMDDGIFDNFSEIFLKIESILYAIMILSIFRIFLDNF